MQNFSILNFPESEWPINIKNIPDKPKKLFIRGAKINDNYKFLTIIGPRKHSNYAKIVTEYLINDLTGYPIYIVSGLAIGIDAFAHKMAIKYKIKTISFPGSELSDNLIYPAINRNLATNILQNGGTLISESNNNQKTQKWFFPQRNRLMAGISDAILIIEAKEKSGTLITARLGLDYNKNILSIPNSIFSQNSIGSNNLLKNGAYVINKAKDILEILGLENYKKEVDTREENKSIILGKLTSSEKIIIQLLDKEITNSEELQRKSKITVSNFNKIITSLEIRGLIQKEHQKIYKKF